MSNAVESVERAIGATETVGGYILIGGASRRMGCDKARLPWRGTTLVEWIARQVHDSVGNVTLAGAPERYRDLGIPAIGESFCGCGPLSGIEAALRHSPSDLNLVVACDMPFITQQALRELVLAAMVGGADVCATLNEVGQPEPLCAVYHRRVLPNVKRALEERRLSARDLLAHFRVDAWRPTDPRMLTNANRPEDWEELKRWMSEL